MESLREAHFELKYLWFFDRCSKNILVVYVLWTADFCNSKGWFSDWGLLGITK